MLLTSYLYLLQLIIYFYCEGRDPLRNIMYIIKKITHIELPLFVKEMQSFIKRFAVYKL